MSHLTLLEKVFLLKKTALFAELDLDLLLAIGDKAEERSCHPQEPIFMVEQAAHRVYVIISGEVQIQDENGTSLALLQAQDFFGDEALFNQQNRAYTATAKGDVHLLTISRTHLMEIMLECPQVAISLLRAYAATNPFRRRI